jgi:hypothetical protein
MQDRKTALLNASTDKRTLSQDRLEAKASPYVVQAGTVIPAALITGIRSDLARPDHRSSHGGGLRQPHRQISADPAGREADSLRPPKHLREVLRVSQQFAE